MGRFLMFHTTVFQKDTFATSPQLIIDFSNGYTTVMGYSIVMDFSWF